MPRYGFGSAVRVEPLTSARTSDGNGATSSAARIRCTRADVGDASAPRMAKRSMYTTVKRMMPR
eukprot:7391093-Prymnesium_polylepis.1